MAKAPNNSAAQRVRKKVRKNIADGIAHVHASFNNTIITITDRQGNACLGLRQVVKVSKAHVNPHHLQRRLLLKWQAVQLLNKASKTWTSKSKAPVQAANLQCVLWPHWASVSRRSLM